MTSSLGQKLGDVHGIWQWDLSEVHPYIGRLRFDLMGILIVLKINKDYYVIVMIHKTFDDVLSSLHK